ncbi:MAG: hypothetical protein AB1465_05535 [Patescibacteria group bacterium]
MQKYKLQLTIIISSALILLFTVFIIYPQIQDINKALKEINNQKVKIEELNNKKENIEKFKNDGAALIEKINKEIGFSLASSDILDLVIKLEEIAKKSNLSAQLQIQEKQKPEIKAPSQDETEEIQKTEKPKTQSPLANIPSLPASVYLEGEFKNILRYLVYLENLSYEIQATSLTINSQTTLPTTPTLPQQPKETTKEKKVNATLGINIFLKD